MAWADPTGDLRAFLSDGVYDRPVKRKQVLGVVDGQNQSFYTFDNRLVTGSLIAYVGDTVVSATVSDLMLGSFSLTAPPEPGTQVRADYYYQYFLDSELAVFLSNAYKQVDATDPSVIPNALQVVVLKFASAFAYTKLAARFMEMKASELLLEDEPARNEANSRSGQFQEMADRIRKEAMDDRKSYYNLRQDSGFAPAWAVVNRTILPWEPRR